jgi:PAS domain S-box-containing protein
MTEDSQPHQAVKVSEEHYRRLFESAPEALFLHDLQGTFLGGNQAVERLLGYSRQELIGKTFFELNLLDDEEVAKAKASLAQLAQGQAVGPTEHKLRRKDGSWIVVEIRSCPVEVENPSLIFGVARDISERKRAEMALKASEQRYRQVFESVNDAIFLRPLPRDGAKANFIEMNGVACKRLGYSREELLQKSPADIDPVTDPREVLQQTEKLLTDEGVIFEAVHVTKDGRQIPVEISARAVDWDGQPMMLTVARDLTERKRLEAQLLQAQKMEAIGQLAGGVAHDFNNILAAVLMHLGLLQRDPQLPAGTKEVLKEVETEAMRAAGLTRQLLLFSRRQVAKTEPLDLNVLITNLLKMLRRLLGEHIEVSFHGSPGAVWVNADAGMLEQVAMNLCINGRDAMPRGGKLTLATAVVDLDARLAQANPNARPGRFVCMSATDRGCGMDEKTLGRIFEPFFTTKPAGKGTGLGLATVYGIVKQHEGWIEVSSEAGTGSVFRVYLPVLSDAEPRVAETTTSETSRAGSETILLVEDEAALRRSTMLCLRRLGYSVLEVSNGVEALAIWQQHRQRIALLFTDMIMPQGMTGLELAQRLRRDKAGLPVIITSGYTAEAGDPQTMARQQILFLSKPCKAATLAKAVEECLARKGG